MKNIKMFQKMSVVLLATCLGSTAAIGAEPTQLSVGFNGGLGNADSGAGYFKDAEPSISSDGRLVVFSSAASNLVENDTNGAEDVFVHDRLSNVTSRVSVASNGAQGNAISSRGSISSNGRYVVFSSFATNLAPGSNSIETPTNHGIFVRDLVTGDTSLAAPGYKADHRPSISDDGAIISFYGREHGSFSDNKYSYDRSSGELRLLSVDTQHIYRADIVDGRTWVSSDGQTLAVYVQTYYGMNVLEYYNNDLFIIDAASGTSTRVNLYAGDPSAEPSKAGVYYERDYSSDAAYVPETLPVLSADLTKVAFRSKWKLLPEDTDDDLDIYFHDRTTGELSLLIDDSDVRVESMSDDGRYFAIRNYFDRSLFVFDRETEEMTEVVGSSFVIADSEIHRPQLSGDGSAMVFASSATNLVLDDTNGYSDVFAVDLNEMATVATCAGQAITVDLSRGEVPTNGDDVILGTEGDDNIDALGGNDIVCALGGNDTVFGKWGVDILLGGSGEDSLFGGSDNDELFGGNGADQLFGNAGEDKIFGGDDPDLLIGGGQNDVLLGDEGDDRMFGSSGDDTLSGGRGEDTLFGFFGADIINGDDGDDLIYGGAGDDVLNGNKGYDRVFGQADNDPLDGGLDDDEVNGGSGDDIVLGGDGDDRMFGSIGDDSLEGGSGNDELNGGLGTDTCDGGNTSGIGRDVAYNCEQESNVP